jgi:hypothetical protein
MLTKRIFILRYMVQQRGKILPVEVEAFKVIDHQENFLLKLLLIYYPSRYFSSIVTQLSLRDNSPQSLESLIVKIIFNLITINDQMI